MAAMPKGQAKNGETANRPKPQDNPVLRAEELIARRTQKTGLYHGSPCAANHRPRSLISRKRKPKRG